MKTAFLSAEGTRMEDPRVRCGGQPIVAKLEYNVRNVTEVDILEIPVTADEVMLGNPVHRPGCKGCPSGTDDRSLNSRVPLLPRAGTDEGEVQPVLEGEANQTVDKGKVTESRQGRTKPREVKEVPQEVQCVAFCNQLRGQHPKFASEEGGPSHVDGSMSVFP